MEIDLPRSWLRVLGEELAAPYFRELAAFVDDERQNYPVYPPAEDVFSAFRLTPFTSARVVVLGQDPYHDQRQAHGLCFSVLPGVQPPPSLRNIFRELHEDLGCPPPVDGCLIPWARSGVLLLNTVLTVRSHQPHSHRGRGWETFTDAVIDRLNRRRRPLVFVLWGRPAQQKMRLIDRSRHAVVTAAHPSPLSAHRGFFGSRPFSEVNRELQRRNQSPVDWCLEGT